MTSGTPARSDPADFVRRPPLVDAGHIRTAWQALTRSRRARQLERALVACNRKPQWGLGITLLLLAVQIGPHWYAECDSSIYLSSARAMAQGRDLQYLDSPLDVGLPGYPMLLVPAFWFGNRPFLLLALINWLIAAAGTIGVYLWARRRCPSAAVLITMLTMLNAATLLYYRRSLKELAVLTVLIWTGLALQRLYDQQRHDQQRHDQQRRPGILVLALTSLFLGPLLVLIRYTGILLFAGYVWATCIDFSQRSAARWQRIALAVLLVTPAVLCTWNQLSRQRALAAQRQLVNYQDYFSQGISELDRHYLEGLRLQISSIGRITIPGMFKAYARNGHWLNINTCVYSLWLVLIVRGWWHLARHKDVLALALPLFVAAYVIWPFDQGPRFLVPMAPVLIACTWLGACPLFRNRHTVLAMLLVGHVTVSTAYWITTDRPRAQRNHQQWMAVEKLASTLQDNRQPVAMRGPIEMQWMLQLAYDQRIRPYHADRPIGGDLQWIIQPPNHRGRDGFVPYRRIGDLVVWTRLPPAQVSGLSP